jgi:hypothetical protein
VAVGDTVGLIEVIKSFTPMVAEQAAVRDPAAFLLDKPLSALNAALRQSLRSDGLAGVAVSWRLRLLRPARAHGTALADLLNKLNFMFCARADRRRCIIGCAAALIELNENSDGVY